MFLLCILNEESSQSERLSKSSRSAQRARPPSRYARCFSPIQIHSTLQMKVGQLISLWSYPNTQLWLFESAPSALMGQQRGWSLMLAKRKMPDFKRTWYKMSWETYLMDINASSACAFMRNHSSSPFFAFYSIKVRLRKSTQHRCFCPPAGPLLH